MDMTPKQIVEELDKYIIGQDKAKRAVAIALRNRYRRSKLSKTMQDEITPKNIIMKGPTGVGKTEIARRLSKLVKAPFVKVEASKYTEVGYVGRDVESMVRDLVEASFRMVKDEKYNEVIEKVTPSVEKRIFDAIYPLKKSTVDGVDVSGEEFKEYIRKNLSEGKYDEEYIELEVKEQQKSFEMMPGAGMEINIGDMLGGMFPQKRKKRKMTVHDAREILEQEECEKIIDLDSVKSEAVRRAEQEGIIFIDEIDKIAGGGGRSNGPEVSREGVQRDILPIVEGSTVNTKYGIVKTDYILFIASGAFHVSKVEDLIPELQGRFPIRVELENLTAKEFFKILTEPKNAVTLQYQELLKVDNINLIFKTEALKEIARYTEEENTASENLGARRLHTVIEWLLSDISFTAGGEQEMKDVVIDKEYVTNAFKNFDKEHDLRKYVL
ncbi:MAG: ATP-dependent protease ATPase subunit HslU [Clostridia bacterium]|nr:ATP-dependent protease ATPase subunit HslU [Clostridia bacterium]